MASKASALNLISGSIPRRLEVVGISLVTGDSVIGNDDCFAIRSCNDRLGQVFLVSMDVVSFHGGAPVSHQASVLILDQHHVGSDPGLSMKRFPSVSTSI